MLPYSVFQDRDPFHEILLAFGWIDYSPDFELVSEIIQRIYLFENIGVSG